MIVEGLAPQDCWQHDNKGERVFVYAAFGVNRSLAHLGQYRAVLAGPALRALGGAPKFWRWIARQCQARNLPIDNIHTVSARLPYGDAEEVQFLCA